MNGKVWIFIIVAATVAGFGTYNAYGWGLLGGPSYSSVHDQTDELPTIAFMLNPLPLVEDQAFEFCSTFVDPEGKPMKVMLIISDANATSEDFGTIPSGSTSCMTLPNGLKKGFYNFSATLVDRDDGKFTSVYENIEVISNPNS